MRLREAAKMINYKKQKAKCFRCPACGSTCLLLVHPSSAFLPWWLWGWHVECQKGYHRGKKKLFLRRAVKAWNKEKRK